MTNTTLKMPDYKEIYQILMRDSDIRYSAITRFNFQTDDHQAVVKWAAKEYPAEYKEALDIASNPNRETVTFWKDDLDWFVEEKNTVEWERDGFSSLIYDFVNSRNLQKEFFSFIQKLMKEDHDGIYGDLESIAKDYM